MPGGRASPAAQVSEAGGGSGGLWGYPGMAVAFLHSQLRGLRERPFSLSLSAFYTVASFSAPTILATTPSPLGFHRHLRGQLMGSWEGAVCPHRHSGKIVAGQT